MLLIFFKGDIMDNTVTEKLQNLKVVLQKIMGPESLTCVKYTDALEDAIDFIDNTKITVSTKIFRVTEETTPMGGVIIDLFSSDDEHLQTLSFDPADLIDDEIYGDA